MKSIRIGNDIRIEWPIVLSGDVEKLKDLDLTVEVRPSAKIIDTHNYADENSRKEVTVMMNGGVDCLPDIGDGKEHCQPCRPRPHCPTAPVLLPYHIEDNTLIAMWTADRQFATGDYDIMLYAHKNEGGQAVCDQYRFVRLVSHTAEADAPDGSGIEAVIAMQPVTLKLAGLSAYEVAVINGFNGTEEEWLESLKKPAEDAAEELKQEIEQFKEDTKEELQADIKALGYYEDNPEFIRAYTDAEGKFLWGIRIDGSIEWAKGVPTPVQNALKELADKLGEIDVAMWPLTASFSASPSVVEYTGSAKEITLSWTVKRKGANATVTSLTVKQGSNSIYSGTANPGSQKVSVNTKGSTKYDLSATADGMTVTGSAVVNMVLPMYFGFAEATSASVLNITSLGKQAIKTSPGGTYTLTNGTEGHYMWLCVPDTMTISRVTLNGFDVPMEAAQSASTSLGGYKCYRSSNALVAQSYTIVIS